MTTISNSKLPTDVDRLFGERLRLHRKKRGLSLMALAELASCSWQQVQKYETGTNRVTLGRAIEFAALFGTTVERMLDVQPVQSETSDDLGPLASILSALEPDQRARLIAEFERLAHAE